MTWPDKSTVPKGGDILTIEERLAIVVKRYAPPDCERMSPDKQMDILEMYIAAMTITHGEMQFFVERVKQLSGMSDSDFAKIKQEHRLNILKKLEGEFSETKNS